MQDVVIQLHAREYYDFARYLSALNFRAIVLDTPRRCFHTALQLLLQYVCGLRQLLPHLSSLRGMRTVVVFSHFALARCGLMSYERLFCFGFLVHDPRWFRVVRWLVRLDRAHDHYVIFSESESELYRTTFGIERERMHFVPLGDWRQIRAMDPPTGPERGTTTWPAAAATATTLGWSRRFALFLRASSLCVRRLTWRNSGRRQCRTTSRCCATCRSRDSMNTFGMRKPGSSHCDTIRVRLGRAWHSR